MNIRKVQSQLRSKYAQHTRKLERVVAQAAKALLGFSNELVPTQTGDLAASGKVISSVKSDGTVESKVVYTAEHAVYVHEDLEKAHGKVFNAKYATQIANSGSNHPYYFNRREQEQAKFLETPTKTKRQELRAIIRNGMKS